MRSSRYSVPLKPSLSVDQISKVPYKLRIITGYLKGRRMLFPALPGTKISRDAVRETFFNGLSHVIASGSTFPFQGMRVLDSFAGSGILGFEALSRGASFVLFVEKNPAASAIISSVARQWGLADKVHTLTNDFFKLQPPAEPFDLIILDPPYPDNSLAAVLNKLQIQEMWLKKESWIGIKTFQGGLQDVPESFKRVWHKDVGLSSLALLQLCKS